jgi:hypothetical protein
LYIPRAAERIYRGFGYPTAVPASDFRIPFGIFAFFPIHNTLPLEYHNQKTSLADVLKYALFIYTQK